MYTEPNCHVPGSLINQDGVIALTNLMLCLPRCLPVKLGQRDHAADEINGEPCIYFFCDPWEHGRKPRTRPNRQHGAPSGFGSGLLLNVMT